MVQRAGIALAISFFIVSCGTSRFAPPPDVDSGSVAGVVAQVSDDSLDTQHGLIAVGAALAEVFADSNVRVALGQSINNNIPASTCVTSTSLGFGTFVNFGACPGGAGQATFITTPFLNIMNFGDETTPVSYMGVTMYGGLGVSPVDGQPLTYVLTPDLGAGETTPMTVSTGAGPVPVTVDFTASLRVTGPNLLVWGEGVAGTDAVPVYMGEPGTVDATGNPPSWQAPPQTCACPTAGQTGVGTVLTIDQLILDLDLMVDGDGIGNDDFNTFNLDIDDIIFSDAQVVLDFQETCGEFEANFGAGEDMVLKVAKADILAAIEASDLPGDEKSAQKDAANSRLKDEITLDINKDVLAAGAQDAFGATFDSSVCTM